MFCPECRLEYGPGVTTCADCNVLLLSGRAEGPTEPPSPSKPTIVCTNCGQVNAPEAQRCIRCGFALYQFVPQPPPQYYAPPKQAGVSTGVKIGIGIVVGMLLAMGGCVACGVFLVGNTARRVQDRVQEKEQSAGAAVLLLEFEDLKAETKYSYTTLTGRVRNNSDFTFKWVKVGADWSDSNGRIVNSDYTYLVAGEELPPGAAKAFQIMSRQDSQATRYRMRISEAR